MENNSTWPPAPVNQTPFSTAPAEHQLDFVVSQEVVTAATRRFWMQYVGWGGLIKWILASLFMLGASIYVRAAWAYIPTALVIVMLPLMWIVGYFTFLRRGMRRLARMQNRRITYRFSTETLATTSEFGSGEVPWRMLDKVQRYPDVWLLFQGERTYIYLPAEQLTEPLAAYIVKQAEAHGVKVT